MKINGEIEKSEKADEKRLFSTAEWVMMVWGSFFES
jgi:hypothetical protein